MFDGARLRRRALDEFAAAVRTGRLIAFVGSYMTQPMGYDSWSDFLDNYAKHAEDLGKSGDPARTRHALKAIEAIRAKLDVSNDAALTGLSVIEYALAYASDREGNLLEKLQERGAAEFHLPPFPPDQRTNVQRLLEDLTIDRIITLNYDCEFEWELMTSFGDKKAAGGQGRYRWRQFDKLLKDRVIARDECGSLSRILPNGKSVVSDLFSRGRTDRLIDFAVGSPDYEAHILHLHGRATDPKSMVVSQRDYNNQYRRSGVAKLPFEHALRILFAGNPILFVGVGMNEGDVTATLEQFVSDNPNRRTSPVFILWNGPEDDANRDAQRFRWLHRFGALVLFDDELTADAETVRASSPTERLANSITNAAREAANRSIPFEWKFDDFRNVAVKLASPGGHNGDHFDIWPTPPEFDTIAEDDEARTYVSGSGTIRLFIGEPGSGKGGLSKRLRQAWHDQDKEGNRRSCIINASFTFETDSVFSLLTGLADGLPAFCEKRSRPASLKSYLANGDTQQLLLVINGLERFLSPRGSPLSSELDSLLRGLIDFSLTGRPDASDAEHEAGTSEATAVTMHRMPLPITIYVLGTERVRRYFNALTDRIVPLIIDSNGGRGVELPLPKDGARSVYFNQISKAFADRGCDDPKLPTGQLARVREKVAGDRAGLRRSFLSTFLQSSALHAAGVKSPDLCLDILTLMATIGQPIETVVLIHCPRIRNRIELMRNADKKLDRRVLIADAVADLVALKLLIPTTAFPGVPQSWSRYGLHRAVLTEIRDRLSVPLTDAQLSAGFNVSMFVALPADGYSPEREIHEELGTLVDWLTGAYRDQPLAGYDKVETSEKAPEWDAATRSKIRRIMTHRSLGDSEPDLARAWPHVSACLRAALALLRSYYSTSTLLMVDPSNGVPRPDEDGPLTQHSDRLDRILRAATENALARRQAADALAAIGAEAWLGPAPYYSDDLIWLHNERGVIKLAQGDLYEARLAFNQALELNENFVEFGERGQNWRRIMLNQVHVDIERAWLDRAEKKMNQIDDAIQQMMNKPISDIREAVIDSYGQGPARELHAADPYLEQDIVVSVALMYGYRGLILHIQGQLQAAYAFLELATTILDNIGEIRAYAVFQRHLTSLLAALGEDDKATLAMKMTVSSGEATKQSDIAHHARITDAARRFKAADVERRGAIVRQLRSALSYAEAGDMHRVRIEAGLNLARLRFESGDYDVALEHAADAMATASRYGLNLRKITLRILVGQILISRGDPVSGRALVEKAIKNAGRVGYQQAVEAAERVLVAAG
ncbi:SIR2 family protein [Novosphingobium sp. CECT 9465]|uniref:SIR2 family protein n=1 Tax=Novosphingobium sp. CECT 9465 TaxID=2829794 RepID=UPI001E641BEC|nr:SIR2 family protein [Novosphingobium sp. CECT 9465]